MPQELVFELILIGSTSWAWVLLFSVSTGIQLWLLHPQKLNLAGLFPQTNAVHIFVQSSKLTIFLCCVLGNEAFKGCTTFATNVNRYPLDTVFGFVNTYLLNSDLFALSSFLNNSTWARAWSFTWQIELSGVGLAACMSTILYTIFGNPIKTSWCVLFFFFFCDMYNYKRGYLCLQSTLKSTWSQRKAHKNLSKW